MFQWHNSISHSLDVWPEDNHCTNKKIHNFMTSKDKIVELLKKSWEVWIISIKAGKQGSIQNVVPNLWAIPFPVDVILETTPLPAVQDVPQTPSTSPNF